MGKGNFPRRLAGIAVIVGVLYVCPIPAADPGAVIFFGILAIAFGIWLIFS